MKCSEFGVWGLEFGVGEHQNSMEIFLVFGLFAIFRACAGKVD
jgi:hypothetical protein